MKRIWIKLLKLLRNIYLKIFIITFKLLLKLKKCLKSIINQWNGKEIINKLIKNKWIVFNIKNNRYYKKFSQLN